MVGAVGVKSAQRRSVRATRWTIGAEAQGAWALEGVRREACRRAVCAMAGVAAVHYLRPSGGVRIVQT